MSVSTMSEQEHFAASWDYLKKFVWENQWIPHEPTEKQLRFLLLTNREAFYGGAAGGGKSDALLMGALMFAEIPGYQALILRRTYPELALENSIMDRAHHWLGGTDARWSERLKRYAFPSGATLSFGHLQHENDKYIYKSSEFHFIAFDELTGFTESQYRYLFSRLRRRRDSLIPVRMRSASNPGDIGHDWVKRRFVNPGSPQRPYVPARLEDNPHLDAADYELSLAELDPVTRDYLRHGNWEILPGGNKFKRHWFDHKFLRAKPEGLRLCRYWDLAATEPKRGGDPDWTAGALLGTKDGYYYLLDMRRDRLSPGQVEGLIRTTAREDGVAVTVAMEQEPGASGKTVIDHYRRRVLDGYDFRALPSTGSKEVRANPVSATAEAGNLFLVEGPWTADFLDELCAFPAGSHDDQVDALSGAFATLNRAGEITGDIL